MLEESNWVIQVFNRNHFYVVLTGSYVQRRHHYSVQCLRSVLNCHLLTKLTDNIKTGHAND